jgi:hypothetical protein
MEHVPNPNHWTDDEDTTWEVCLICGQYRRLVPDISGIWTLGMDCDATDPGVQSKPNGVD